MSNLAFFSADTLGVTLYQVDGVLKAHEIRQLWLGPWRMDLDVEVVSDLLTGKEMTFWVTFAGRLRMYVIIREKENWLAVLDEGTLKTIGQATGFIGKTVKERVLEFKPAMRGLFRWEDNHWTKMQYDAAG